MRFLLIALAASALAAQDAGDEFRALVQKHADRSAVERAAAQWEARESDPARHLLAVEEIARDFLAFDPQASLEYCWKVRNAPQLWPIMLDAAARVKNWPLAERYGEAVFEEVDAGRMLERWEDASEVSHLRRQYAAALEAAGKKDIAGKQLALAASERDRRMPELRAEVLASAIDQPGPPFRLRDARGREISLDDFHGKPLVAVFWASWCAPCAGELRELRPFYEKSPDRLIAVSVDENRNAAAEFASKYGFDYPILMADRDVEHAYTFVFSAEGVNIPQLYVFDGRGHIRFHIIGFEDDGMLRQKVEWMVRAAE